MTTMQTFPLHKLKYMLKNSANEVTKVKDEFLSHLSKLSAVRLSTEQTPETVCR